MSSPVPDVSEDITIVRSTQYSQSLNKELKVYIDKWLINILASVYLLQNSVVILYQSFIYYIE